MKFKKYQHIEKLGTDDVEGILDGKIYLFYKIDGTNASVWTDDKGNIEAGSRNRKLSEEEDNFGFYKEIMEKDNIKEFLGNNPNLRLYGEWLVPHSLKTYQESAWRKFYVFDVVDKQGNYWHYEDYKPLLEKYDIEYIPPLAVLENPSKEDIIKRLNRTGEYLIEDGEGKGEGIVIKNYKFYNKYGRMNWAKVVRNNFKKKHRKQQTQKEESSKVLEREVVNELLEPSWFQKEFEKVKKRHDDSWKSEYIPELIGRSWHTFIKEESWNIVQKFNRPKVDFGRLKRQFIQRLKKELPEVF